MKKITNFIYRYCYVFIIFLISISVIILSKEDNEYMKYNSEDELINTFLENENLFIETTEVLKNNEIFNEIMEKTGDNALRDANNEYVYNYFTKDEIETLRYFFDTTKPYMIKKIPGGIQFKFYVKKSALSTIQYDIFYFYSDNDIEKNKEYIMQFFNLLNLKDDSWFYSY